jgi:Tol biopolymer transport system component
MGADGRDRRQVTDDGFGKRYPCATPDGRYFVFDSYRAGSIQLWRVNVDGSNPKAITAGPGFSGDCSRSNDEVVYTTFGPGGFSIWKAAIDGTSESQLINKYTLIPAVSPDGKLIACYSAGSGSLATKISFFPITGGEPLQQFDMIQSASAGSPQVHWLPDGSSVAYIATRGGVSNIWTQTVSGGPPKQLTDFKTDRVFWFDISRDGKQFVLSRGTVNSDIVLMKDFVGDK